MTTSQNSTHLMAQNQTPRLLIGATPHAGWQLLEPVLSALGWNDRQDDPENWYVNVKSSGNLATTDLYLLLYSKPERVIAKAMQSGASCSEAFENWKEAVTNLLAFYKKHPTQAALVEVESARNNYEALVAWLQQNRGVKVSKTVAVGAASTSSEPEESASELLQRLIATQQVAQNSGAKELLNELEAATVPLENGLFNAPQMNVDTTWETLHELISAEKVAPQQVEQLSKENELLLLQLHNVQEELERYYFHNRELTELLTEKDDQLSRLKSLKKEHEKLKFARRRLVYELHQARLVQRQTSPKARLKKLIGIPARLLGKLSPKKRQIPAQLRMVSQSDLFDAAWYLEKNRDVRESTIDPLVHFVLFGGQEGRAPSKWFSSKWYLSTYPDVAQSGVNPLVHYLSSGKDEGRKISPGKHKVK